MYNLSCIKLTNNKDEDGDGDDSLNCLSLLCNLLQESFYKNYQFLYKVRACKRILCHERASWVGKVSAFLKQLFLFCKCEETETISIKSNMNNCCRQHYMIIKL
jgi:hypothetical protein